MPQHFGERKWSILKKNLICLALLCPLNLETKKRKNKTTKNPIATIRLPLFLSESPKKERLVWKAGDTLASSPLLRQQTPCGKTPLKVESSFSDAAQHSTVWDEIRTLDHFSTLKPNAIPSNVCWTSWEPGSTSDQLWGGKRKVSPDGLLQAVLPSLSCLFLSPSLSFFLSVCLSQLIAGESVDFCDTVRELESSLSLSSGREAGGPPLTPRRFLGGGGGSRGARVRGQGGVGGWVGFVVAVGKRMRQGWASCPKRGEESGSLLPPRFPTLSFSFPLSLSLVQSCCPPRGS